MKKKLSMCLVFLFLLVHCLGFIALATEKAVVKIVDKNTEFAIKTAEMIKDAESPSLMLRIIGKFKQIPKNFDSFDITDSVISEDGRFVLQFDSENELLKCLKELRSNSNIIYAEQDKPVYVASLEESKEHVSWGVDAIEADKYSDSIVLPSEDSSVTVAIVDSGCADIDYVKSKLVQGYDFVDNDTDATNDTSIDSHGTFLASIITDCTSKLPVNIMPVRVLSSISGSLINAVNGIFYAVDNGADVINISLVGVLSDCSSLDDALMYAEQNNVSVVVCAGNSKSDIENYCPAHNETAITVSSVNDENEFSESFSNFGDKIDISAPGENIVGYNALGEKTTLSGTSMSAAFVSAAALMFRLENPGCNTKQVRDSLTACAEDFGETGWDKYYGYGVLRLGKLAESKIKYVESVKFELPVYTLYVGESLTIFPVFIPEDSNDKSFVLIADNSNVEIVGDQLLAVSEGKSVLTVVSNDGSFSDSCEIIIQTRKMFTIEWNINGEMYYSTYEERETIVPPEIPEIMGYTFAGWNPVLPDTMPAEDLSFTAVFEVIEPEVPATPSEPLITKPIELTMPSTTEPLNKPIEESTTKSVVTEPSTTKLVEENTTNPFEESTTKPTESTTKPVTPPVTELKVSVEIRKPSQTEIKYGDSIILHADIEGVFPKDAEIVWTADNANFTIVEVSADGKACTVTPSANGDTVFTAKIVDENGKEICSDTQTMTSKAGFFRKVIAFFKKLFGMTKVIPGLFKGFI